jgi:hypothetical protein
MRKTPQAVKCFAPSDPDGKSSNPSDPAVELSILLGHQVQHQREYATLVATQTEPEQPLVRRFPISREVAFETGHDGEYR